MAGAHGHALPSTPPNTHPAPAPVLDPPLALIQSRHLASHGQSAGPLPRRRAGSPGSRWPLPLSLQEKHL